MKIICPHCGTSGKAADALAEQEVSCPECGGKFIAPCVTAYASEATDSGEVDDASQATRPAPPWLKKKEERAEDILLPPPELTAWGLVRESWRLSRHLRFAVVCRVGAVLLFLLMIAISLLLDNESGLLISLLKGVGLPAALVAGIGLLLTLVSMGLGGNVEAGLPYLGIRHGMGKRVGLATCFRGFLAPHFKALFIAGIIKTGLTMMGFVLLIIPGIYLSFAYWLAMPLIIDRGLTPWQALELSRKAVTKVWFQVVGAYLIMTVLPVMFPVIVAARALSRGFVQYVEQTNTLAVDAVRLHAMFPADIYIIAGCLVVIVALGIYLLPCIFASYGVLYNKLFIVREKGAKEES